MQTVKPPLTLKQRLDAYEKLMRLDKPIGILLLLWPALWGLWFASPWVQRLEILLIFVVGVVLMRSAGCVMNDYADRDFDPHVKRTADRPLAQRIISPNEALLLAAALALAAFGLVLFLNKLTIALSVVALFLAATYPFLKRFFPLPQAYLGIAFGFSIPMAFAAYHNSVPPLAWILLAANIFWAIAYDTEYAMVDRDDDMKLNLNSSALLFGVYDVAAVALCHTLFLGIMAGVGVWLKLGLVYFLGLALAAAMVVAQLQLIKTRERENCFKAFMNNNWVGAAVFGGLAVDFFHRFPIFK
ncbi:MAG: 4-hydroxybenzoate octaprenyltransferase [Betaproteobacteria bacterium]|nr:4-hydroxybenzoate octaprenyltransferase [Betaproteobacteria bacterium]